MGSQSAAGGSFSAPPSTHTFSGFLFDMDGTIIDSTDAITKHWHKLGKELNFDADVLLATSHGRRSIDTLKLIAPEKANWEYISHMEGLIPVELGSNAVEIPGARASLEKLKSISARWAIVTSGTKALMGGWLKVMSLPPPPVSVTAEEVETGKPDPACYSLGRERIGLSANHRVLVVEDAPSGIKAGKAAGCTVLGLATTHSIESVITAGADLVVKDLQSVRVLEKRDNGDVEIQILNGWVPSLS